MTHVYIPVFAPNKGHHYTRRLILRPISAARPRIDLCTKNSPSRDGRCRRHSLTCMGFQGAPHQITTHFVYNVYSSSIKTTAYRIEGFHVTSLQQNLLSHAHRILNINLYLEFCGHAAHSSHVGYHKIWPNSLLLKFHKA